MSKCASEKCCLFVRGNLAWRDVVDACGHDAAAKKPFEKVGELSAFGYTPQITTIGGQKSLSLEGGTGCVVTTFDGLQISMDVRCASNSNLAVALFGDFAEIAAGTSKTQTVDRSEIAGGAYVPLNHAGATNITIVEPAGAVEGVDYKKTPAGIEILHDSTVLFAGMTEDLEITYNTPLQSRLEVGTRNSVTKELLFNGKDQEGNAIVFRLYKVTIAGSGDIQWLNQDDFVTFTITGTAQADDTVSPAEFATGLPKSQFGFIQRVAA